MCSTGTGRCPGILAATVSLAGDGGEPDQHFTDPKQLYDRGLITT
jgi:hypothetical protein